MDGSLSGKVAVVTGASSGIGLATARALADAGAILVVAARSNERLEQTARDLGITATAIPTDVTSTKEVDDLLDKTLELHGRIDILRAERTARLKAQVAAGSFHAPSPTSLDRPIFEGTGELPEETELEPLDLAGLGDDELWAEIRRLEKEEYDISLNRRVMHAQIDIIRAERAKRSRGGDHVDPGDLGSILGGGG